MKLVLIRHGESEWNQKNLFTGWTDVELTDKGRKEAQMAGVWLKQKRFDFDVCYTSYLKRAVHTLDIVLDELDRVWLPVIKTWKLNERHYGALQGLNKSATAAKYGEEQVKIWRRSFDVCPPLLSEDDERNPALLPAYKDVDKNALPLGESLKDTIERVVPFYHETILKDMKAGKKVIVAAHGNSLRALVKILDGLSDEEIVGVNIPTGVPLVYKFDKEWNVKEKYYLGDAAAIKDKIDSVAAQGKA